MLSIKDLKVSVKKTHTAGSCSTILDGINLSVGPGEVHAIMGPNGSGKSTLAMTIMGHPRYVVTNGSIKFNSKNITKHKADERSRQGIFIAFQNPLQVEGVTLGDFLYQIYQSKDNSSKSMDRFKNLLSNSLKLLKIKPEFLERSLNLGFSGGEKKRAEILQLAILQPKLVILDEIDSGLDVDALKTISNAIIKIKKENQDMALVIITHYPRILHHLKPNNVHVMQNGIIVKSGTEKLAETIEQEGYKN